MIDTYIEAKIPTISTNFNYKSTELNAEMFCVLIQIVPLINRYQNILQKYYYNSA